MEDDYNKTITNIDYNESYVNNNLKFNMIGIRPPNNNDNKNKGYNVGSRWYDRMTFDEYVCVSSSNCNAIWIKTTLKNEDLPSPINDSITNSSQTWSSEYINSQLLAISSKLDITINNIIEDEQIVDNKTWSSQLIASKLDEQSNKYHMHYVSDIIDFNLGVVSNSEVSASSKHRQQTNNPHKVTKEQVGLGYISNIKSNYIATIPPSEINDLSEGYNYGSRWINIKDRKEYVLIDPDFGKAVWIETTFNSLISNNEQILLNKTIDAFKNNIFNIGNQQIRPNANIDATKISNGIVTNEMFNKLATLDILNIKNIFDATVKPQPYNDIMLGFSVGSRWVDINHDKEYVCLNNTINNAVWVQTTNEPGEINIGNNVGNGQGIYKGKLDTKLNFKSLKNGQDITLTSTNDEITINAKSVKYYLMNQTPIDAITTTFKTIILSPWLYEEFGIYNNGKIIIYVEIDECELNIRVIDSQDSILGSLYNIDKSGFYSFLVANPSKDSLLRIQISKSENDEYDPRIISMVIKYET